MALVCPMCRQVFDPARHRWKHPAAMPGRAPGWLWNHRRPDNGKGCTYVDAGPLRGYTETASGAILGAATEERDAPAEARMVG